MEPTCLLVNPNLQSSAYADRSFNPCLYLRLQALCRPQDQCDAF
jgi:hypothetical protein